MFMPPLDEAANADNLEELLLAHTCVDLFANDGATLLPDLTVENVDKLAQLLQKDSGCLFNDPKFNTIVRRFHRLRYAK